MYGGTYNPKRPTDSLKQLMQELTGGHSSMSVGSPATGLNNLLGGPGAYHNLLQSSQPFSDLLGLSGTREASQQQQQEQASALEQLLAGMVGDIGGSDLNAADYEQALRDSAAQIKGAFGAEIGAVRASSRQARRQTKRGKRQIKRMYAALNREYQKDAQGELALGKQVTDQLGKIAADASGAVKGTADQLLNEQAALAENLGVASAAPDQMNRISEAASGASNRINQIAQNDRNLQMANSGAQQRFLVRGGKNALLEGTNRRADLVEQLQAFLQQNLAKIADLKGQRGRALAANANSIASSMGQAQNDASEQKWDRSMELAKLLASLQGQQQGGMGDQNSAIPSWMKQQSALIGGDTEVGSLIQDLFLNNPNIVTGKSRDSKSGMDYSTNPISAGSIAYQEALKKGMSQDQAILAQLAAMMQYGAVG